MLLDRVLLALIIVAAAIAVWIVYNRWSLRRLAAHSPVDPLLQTVERGTPIIVYFTTPTCVPCRTQQQPALARLEAQLAGGVQIVKVDALEHTEASDRWGVFSAPTTFVLDAQLRPRFVNRGVATADQLHAQVIAAAH